MAQVEINLEDIKYDIEGDLPKVIGRLQELQTQYTNEGYQSLRIDVDTQAYDYSYGNDSYAVVQLLGKREETAEEIRNREETEAKVQAYLEASQRKAFEALKKKFGETS